MIRRWPRQGRRLRDAYLTYTDVIQASHANDVPPPSRSRRRSFSLLDDQAFRPEICCLDETRKGAGLALACRPAGNIAHRSTAGSDQSPARISPPISRGTQGSNPAPSSGESRANLPLLARTAPGAAPAPLQNLSHDDPQVFYNAMIFVGSSQGDVRRPGADVRARLHPDSPITS